MVGWTSDNVYFITQHRHIFLRMLYTFCSRFLPVLIFAGRCAQDSHVICNSREIYPANKNNNPTLSPQTENINTMWRLWQSSIQKIYR